MPVLQIGYGTDRPHVHLLPRGRILLGRSLDCGIVLDDGSVSGHHCAISADGLTFRVTNLSRHGTWVGDRLLQNADEATLSVGSTLLIGRYRAVVLADHAVRQRTRRPTELHPLAVHEVLETANAEEIVTTCAELALVAGPLAGRRYVLEQPRVELGGANATIHLGRVRPPLGTPPDAVLRVTRGRAVLEPGGALARVGGRVVDEPHPIDGRDVITLGEHQFVVREVTVRAAPSAEHEQFGELYGTGEGMRLAIGLLRKLAGHTVTVLIEGETGAGKGVAAKALHDASARNGEFVPVNMTAIPRELFESILFGHEAGAFTSATGRRDGHFQQAANGTLFLDEIGDLDLELQAKLLYALDGGAVYRVGGHAQERITARIVVGTNRDLARLVAEGRFREDLYYRLATRRVVLPPLRERVADIPVLVDQILDRLGERKRLTPAAQRALAAHPWPGNVRELAALIETATVYADGALIDTDHLSFLPAPGGPPQRDATALTEEEITAAYGAHGTREKAAKALGVSLSALNRRVKALGVVLRGPRDA